MTNNNLLQIGDKIGFTYLAQDVDLNDKVLFMPVVAIGERDGEPAYFFQYPDGDISRAGIPHSTLSSYTVERRAEASPKMICLSERKGEIAEALTRGKDQNLEVFPDWERDGFVVVNHTGKSEYRVKLETVGGQVWSECECCDFEFRKRVCKHIGEVLINGFSVAATRK